MTDFWRPAMSQVIYVCEAGDVYISGSDRGIKQLSTFD